MPDRTVNQEDRDPGDGHYHGKYELTVRKELILARSGPTQEAEAGRGTNSVPS